MDNSDIRILVVDDDPDILFATMRVLKKAGYDVLGAGTGNECLEQTTLSHPDLILLDVQLPDILVHRNKGFLCGLHCLVMIIEIFQ